MDALYFTVTVLFVSVLVAALLFRAAHHHTHGILQRMAASRLVKLVADDIFIAAGTIAPAWKLEIIDLESYGLDSKTHGETSVDAHGADVSWPIPRDFDCSIPTCVAYRHQDYLVHSKYGTSNTKTYNPAVHGNVFGEFAHIRHTLDYTWHTNYCPERQAWQDHTVRKMVPIATAQDNPWLVFTCGAMGSGKGYVMGWLSQHSEFPLEDLVHIDPDQYKSMMPEWAKYVENGNGNAGAMCHQESCFLQELCQEVAMTRSCNVWIDGSLGDAEWFAHEFKNIRKRFPHYRIAIVNVHCSDGKIFSRAAQRGNQTGRYISDEKLHKSIKKTRISISALAPLADLVVKVDNEAEMLLPTHSKVSSSSEKPALGNELDMRARLQTFFHTVNRQLQSSWIEVQP